MVLFLGGPEQELTGKIDVFQQIDVFLLAIVAKRGNFNFMPLSNNIDFNNLLLLCDEANYVELSIAKRQHA